jgi:hypothetical protein
LTRDHVLGDGVEVEVGGGDGRGDEDVGGVLVDDFGAWVVLAMQDETAIDLLRKVPEKHESLTASIGPAASRHVQRE